MKLKDIPNPVWWAALALIAGGVLYLFARRGVRAVASAVNPADPGNLVNRGVTAAGAAVTGDESFSLGAQLFDAAQAVGSFFGGGPTDSEVIEAPTVTTTPRDDPQRRTDRVDGTTP